jgi:hypothetical protein
VRDALAATHKRAAELRHRFGNLRLVLAAFSSPVFS